MQRLRAANRTLAWVAAWLSLAAWPALLSGLCGHGAMFPSLCCAYFWSGFALIGRISANCAWKSPPADYVAMQAQQDVAQPRLTLESLRQFSDNQLQDSAGQRWT